MLDNRQVCCPYSYVLSCLCQQRLCWSSRTSRRPILRPSHKVFLDSLPFVSRILVWLWLLEPRLHHLRAIRHGEWLGASQTAIL